VTPNPDFKATPLLSVLQSCVLF